MVKGRHGSPRFGYRCYIEVGTYISRSITLNLRNNFAPWIDNHRMAVGRPATVVDADLRRREHKRTVFDRPGAE